MGGALDPTRRTLGSAIRAFDAHRQAGTVADFYRVYSRGQPPKEWYFAYGEEQYPVKAIWAAAHRPAVQSREFNTRDARRGLASLGIMFIEKDEDAVREYIEGERRVRESNTLVRSRALVAKAKKKYGLVCRGCGFKAASVPGNAGNRAIECHHIDPLSKREGKGRPTAVDQLLILCANCHRMIHSNEQALTLNELRRLIR